jgi:hypothetical protein
MIRHANRRATSAPANNGTDRPSRWMPRSRSTRRTAAIPPSVSMIGDGPGERPATDVRLLKRQSRVVGKPLAPSGLADDTQACQLGVVWRLRRLAVISSSIFLDSEDLGSIEDNKDPTEGRRPPGAHQVWSLSSATGPAAYTPKTHGSPGPSSSDLQEFGMSEGDYQGAGAHLRAGLSSLLVRTPCPVALRISWVPSDTEIAKPTAATKPRTFKGDERNRGALHRGARWPRTRASRIRSAPAPSPRWRSPESGGAHR